MTKQSLRRKAYNHARSWIGTVESPPGSNRGLHIDYWNMEAAGVVGIEWCASFMFGMFKAAAGGKSLPIQGPAAVLHWVEWARARSYVVGRPYRFDVVCYSWHGPTPNPADHIGIVERVLALPWPRNGRRFWLRTIEGNDGDAVRRQWRWVDPNTVVFVRVPDDPFERGQVPKPAPSPAPPPAPAPPPSPPLKRSWDHDDGPWIFVESDPGTVPEGPWRRLDISPNLIAQGAPLWSCPGGRVPQAEGAVEDQSARDWIAAHPDASSVAPVTTLGIDVAAWAAMGVTSVFVECYLQAQENAEDKAWQALQEGWTDVIPVIGIGWAGSRGAFLLDDYLPWLKAYGRRFAIYASDPMSPAQWQRLREYLAGLPR